MKRKYFGTDGIRGAFGSELMNPAFAYRVGRGAALALGLEGQRVVIGRDTRESGAVLELALKKGLGSAGVEVVLIGVLPTAAVAAHVTKTDAVAGIMISASHNPFEDNGIKFFGGDGFKLSDEIELKIEAAIDEVVEIPELETSASVAFEGCDAALANYRKVLLNSLPEKFSFGGLKVIVDGGHGAAWKSTPEILKALGAEIETLFCSPDGTNINEGCGSTHPETLQEKVKETEGAVGLAHDGDADRVQLIDEDGELLDGDELLAIAGLAMMRQGTLKGNQLVATVMSNLGLDEAIEEAGGKVLRSAVGDRYVLEMMRKEEAVLGGEQSGHMIFLEQFSTGDGLLSGLQVLRVMREEGKPLKELKRGMRKFPQKLYGERVRKKVPIDELPEVKRALNEVETELSRDGRAFLRYSGTENKIRLLLESKDGRNFDELAERILKPLRETIGA